MGLSERCDIFSEGEQVWRKTKVFKISPLFSFSLQTHVSIKGATAAVSNGSKDSQTSSFIVSFA